MALYELLVNIFAVTGGSKKNYSCFHKNKKYPIAPSNPKRKSKWMINQLFYLQARVTPILFENYLLLFIKLLNTKGQLNVSFGKFFSVNNLHGLEICLNTTMMKIVKRFHKRCFEFFGIFIVFKGFMWKNLTKFRQNFIRKFRQRKAIRQGQAI